MKDLKPHIITFPKIEDPRGNLSFMQHPQQLPFKPQRTYWVYDVPGGEMRYGHAFRTQQEVIVALSGSFDVVTVGLDGQEIRFRMARSYHGLYLPPMMWRMLDNFSTNSVALVISSTLYSPDDYIEDFDEYKTLISQKL
ncbi:MAG: FdtA/QdtA family cupin domain-containing protein [Muribaculum sp.]|nr:FdtA/QdtA family cupin domain-containing protein [Muribaculaceae bacterium]MCM1080920.1 FdtA/QdtA family cupin domain-containing protein [Muribaculum sp.]